MDRPDVVAVVRREVARGALEEDLREADDRVERRPELVRELSQELRALAVGLDQLLVGVLHLFVEPARLQGDRGLARQDLKQLELLGVEDVARELLAEGQDPHQLSFALHRDQQRDLHVGQIRLRLGEGLGHAAPDLDFLGDEDLLVLPQPADERVGHGERRPLALDGPRGGHALDAVLRVLGSVEVEDAVRQGDPAHERLHEGVRQPAHVEEGAHPAPEVRENLLKAVALPEHDPVQPGFDGAAERRERHREQERDDQILPERERVPRVPAFLDVDAEADDEREYPRHQAAVNGHPLGDDAHVDEPVANHRHPEHQREEGVGGDPDRVEPFEPRHDGAREVHIAAEEADDGPPEDQLRAVAPEARLDPPVGQREVGQARQHEDLHVDEEGRVQRAADGRVAPRGQLHALDEQRGRVHRHEEGRERVRDQQHAAPDLGAVQEEQDEVVVEGNHRDEPHEHGALPEERPRRRRGRPEHEHAEVPHREPGQEVRERAVDPALEVPVEDERDQRQVERERDQGKEVVNRHSSAPSTLNRETWCFLRCSSISSLRSP